MVMVMVRGRERERTKMGIDLVGSFVDVFGKVSRQPNAAQPRLLLDPVLSRAFCIYQASTCNY